MAEENNQKSLLDLLVNNEYVTRRQMSRLREIVQAEKSGQKIPGFKVLSKLGAGAMATLRTAALNLLRLAGFQSIRTGMQAVMHDITALLAMAMRQPNPEPI